MTQTKKEIFNPLNTLTTLKQRKTSLYVFPKAYAISKSVVTTQTTKSLNNKPRQGYVHTNQTPDQLLAWLN